MTSSRKSRKSAAAPIEIIEGAGVEGDQVTTSVGIETAEVVLAPETEAQVVPELVELPVEPNFAEFLGSVAPEVIAEVVAELEADILPPVQEPEATVEVSDPPASEEAPVGGTQDEPATPTYDEIVSGIADEEVEDTMHATRTELGVRALFENDKNPDNANIHRTLKKCTDSLVRRHAALAMIAASVDIGFINRSLHDGFRYNVYAVGKFADLVDGLTNGSSMRNAINIACCRSLFKFRAAGVPFTGEMARAAASDKLRVSEAVKKHLIRHTVSASTAPTQASSTMQALETLGVVKAEGSRKNPVYLILDNPITTRLAEVVASMEALAA